MEPLSQSSKYATQKDTTVITDYFDFELGDIEFNQFKKGLDLSKEDCSDISNTMKTFQKYLQTNLSTFTYPYLQKAFIPFHSKLDEGNQKIYLLLLFLSKEDEIEKTLSTFFHSLIKTNHFGINKQYNSLFTENVIHSVDYLHFINKMTKWHTQSEMIIFYLWIMKEYFDMSLDFSQESYSIEKNFKLTFETFAKKNLLKFSSFICGKLSVPLDFSLVDYKTIFFLVMASFTCGTYSLFSAKQIQKLLGVSAVNVGIQKLSELMQYEGQLTDFRKLSGKKTIINFNIDTVEDLNEKLSLIHSMIVKLIKTLFLIRGKTNIDEKNKADIENDVKKLTNKLSLYLSGVNPNSLFTEENMDVIQEIEMRETESDWCIIQDNNP